MILQVPTEGGESKIRLTNLLYSPQLGYTLISITKIDAGYSTTFPGGRCEIRDKCGKVVITFPKTPGLYRAASAIEGEPIAAAGANSPTHLTLMDLHR